MEENLRRLGLTGYEIKVYETLLAEGSMKGGEISRKSNVPHGRTYEVLQKLIQKNLVQQTQTKPKTFRLTEPQIGIDFLIDSKQKELTEIKNNLKESLKKHKPNQIKETDEKIIILSGKRVLAPIIKKELESVKKYFKRMFTFDYLPYDVVRIEKSLIKKGVKFQILATEIDEKKLLLMKKAIQIGYDVKYFPVQELRLSIIDGQKSMINLVNEKNHEDRTVILVESKELTKALESYFDILWKKASPIKSETKIEEML